MRRVWLATGIFGIAALVLSGVVASMATAQAGADPAAIVAAYEVYAAMAEVNVETASAMALKRALVVMRGSSFN